MLGKLIKHEFIRTGRYILMIMAVLVVVTPVAALYLRYGTDFFDSLAPSNPGFRTFNTIMTLLFTGAYIIAVIGMCITTFICLIYSFYKSMVSKESYLTHTLPVKTSSLLISKGIVAYVWSVLCYIMLFLSIIVFTKILIGWTDSEFISNYNEFLRQLNLYGINTGHIILFIIVILSSLVSNITMIGSCFAIGHRMNGHPILGAIVSYIGIYIILQTLISVCIGIISGLGLFTFNDITTSSAFTIMCVLLIIYSIITSVLFYIITYYMFKKKLNI